MSRVGGIGRLDPVADRYRSGYTYDANGNIQTVIRHDADGHPYDAITGASL
ncbi:MAG: hypothetical protein KJZ58_06270 [Flavobacteriales bacterium]|nr:hypothetical protein [Flavobacteriales bacterium]